MIGSGYFGPVAFHKGPKISLDQLMKFLNLFFLKLGNLLRLKITNYPVNA
jgi:hypothetical protein